MAHSCLLYIFGATAGRHTSRARGNLPPIPALDGPAADRLEMAGKGSAWPQEDGYPVLGLYGSGVAWRGDRDNSLPAKF